MKETITLPVASTVTVTIHDDRVEAVAYYSGAIAITPGTMGAIDTKRLMELCRKRSTFASVQIPHQDLVDNLVHPESILLAASVALCELDPDLAPWTDTPTSSNVARWRYDRVARRLDVQFKSGGVYAYIGVTKAVAWQMEAAKSIGSYLHRFIKPHYRAAKLTMGEVAPTEGEGV